MSIYTTYRQMLWSLYVPSTLFSIAVQAVLVLIPLYVIDLGLGAAVAAFIVGVRGVGMLIADIPTGSLATRYGDKPIMVFGSVGVGVGCLLLAIGSDALSLSLGTLLAGFASSAWLVGRLSFISDSSKPEERGRIIAMMAGTQRLGGVLGPLLGGFLAAAIGYEWAIAIAGLIAIATGVLTHFTTENVGAGKKHAANPLDRLSQVLSSHKTLFMTAGYGAMTLMGLRAARQLAIPLFGAAIGLEAHEVGVIYAISAVIDMLMFYPSGSFMDRHGRKSTAVPGAILLALGTLLLPLASGYFSLLAIACIIGLGNGVTTGVLMAMGSDFSPTENRGEFLGVWRFACDFGFAGGPLLFGALIAASGLGLAALVTGAIGLSGAYVMQRFVPESLPPKTAEEATSSSA